MTGLSLKEIHQNLLEILVDVTDFCRERGLRYSLAYGTLLGAVRHKGFIPWDDDVDIIMPRKDFETFVREYRDRGKFNCLYNEPGRFRSCYAKVEDTTTVSIEKKKVGIYNFGLNIDIFPIDGAPSDPQEQKKLTRAVTRIRRRLLLSQRSFFPYSFHVPLPALIEAHTKSPDRWYKECLDLLTAYDMDKSEFAGSISCGLGMRDVYRKEMFDNYVELEFEGCKFSCVADWDSFLRQQYGDYMQLPPENKRRTHNLKVYSSKRDFSGNLAPKPSKSSL